MSKLTLTALLSLLLCNACLMQPASSNISELEAADHSPFPILVGKSTSTRWFWLWETGDSSVDLAQKNGGITQVSSITKSSNNYLGIVVRQTTTVRGK